MGKVTRNSAKKNEEPVSVISENSETESEFFESEEEEESDMEITGSEEDSDIVSNLFVIIYIYIYD
jgi:hypothetical protein